MTNLGLGPTAWPSVLMLFGTIVNIGVTHGLSAVQTWETVLLAAAGAATIVIPALVAVALLLIRNLGTLREAWYTAMRNQRTIHNTVLPAIDSLSKVSGVPSPTGEEPPIAGHEPPSGPSPTN